MAKANPKHLGFSKGGTKPTELSVDLIKDLATIHCTMEEIASILGTSVDTLERRYADIIKEAKANGKSSLRRLQWHAAQAGNTTMLIWLGKQLLNQREKSEETIVSTNFNMEGYAHIEPAEEKSSG